MIIAAVMLGVVALAPISAQATVTKTFSGSVDAAGTKWKQHLFDVVEDGQIQATLNWDTRTADLNLFLHRKNADATWTLVAKATTSDRPEEITYPNGTTGTWKVGVKAASGASAYTLAVSHSPGASVQGASIATYSETFGFKGPAGNYAYGGDWDPSTNTILWGDYWNYRVKRYTITGEKCTQALCGSPFIVTTTKPVGQLGGIGAPYDVETDMFDKDGSNRASFWVADQGNARIVQFSYAGQWLQTIGLGGGGSDAAHPGHNYSRGCANGNMTIPTHIWVDPGNGRLYVSDPRCEEVWVFSHTGNFLFKFARSGWKPRGLAGGRDWDGDGQGDIYVVDHYNRQVVVFNKSGNFLGLFPRVADMNDPRGLDVDPNTGDVVTVSAYKNKVYKFDFPTGNLVASWNEVDGTGTAQGNARFDSIRFPAVDGNGNIYTGDTWGARHPDPRTGDTWTGHEVYKFTANGSPLSWATGPEPPPDGGYNQNNGIALTGSSLFVMETFGQRVQKFDTTSFCRSAANCPGWRLQFGSREPPGANSKGFAYPRGLAFGDGYVWVGDSRAVSAWTTAGVFEHRFGSAGAGPGQFRGGGLGIHAPGDGKVYTTDTGNCRLQVFDVSTALAQSKPAPLAYMGSCGGGANQMSGPRGIAVKGGKAWVADVGNNRIAVWDISSRSSTNMRPSCGGVALRSPTGVAWDLAKTLLYVADTGNKRVVRMSGDGSNCQVVTNGSDTPAGFKGPDYLEFGADGRLYVSDNTYYVYAFTIG
jgi:DNA-binding beta-propeller fold protein YncE